MTPSERAAARELVNRFLSDTVTHGAVVGRAELAAALVNTLDQIDADEGLMRDAVEVFLDLRACNDPECREPNCAHILARLRERLGQEQERVEP